MQTPKPNAVERKQLMNEQRCLIEEVRVLQSGSYLRGKHGTDLSEAQILERLGAIHRRLEAINALLGL